MSSENMLTRHLCRNGRKYGLFALGGVDYAAAVVRDMVRARMLEAMGDMTQQEVADAMKIHQSQVNRRLTGKAGIDVEFLVAFAAAVKCRPSALVDQSVVLRDETPPIDRESQPLQPRTNSVRLSPPAILGQQGEPTAVLITEIARQVAQMVDALRSDAAREDAYNRVLDVANEHRPSRGKEQGQESSG